MSDKLSQSEIDAMLRGLGQSTEGQKGEDSKQKHNLPVVEKVEFAPFKSAGNVSGAQKKELSYFNQIPMIISGELGKANLTVRELLRLEEGSVIKLDKLAGESATILVNGQYLGLAEVVVINERFGLRVTAIGTVDPQIDKKEPDEQKEAVTEEAADQERQDK